MNETDRIELINYRLEQAKETVIEVRKLIDNRLLKIAVNRVYYGMFYSLNALALKHNFQSSKHMQLIGWFNKQFVKEKIVEPTYGEILRSAFKNRSEGDYTPFVEFTKTEVEEYLHELESFINKIESLLK